MPQITRESPGFKVAVIGAGLSGLAAAHQLREHGATVDVYERQAAPGGRVRTVYTAAGKPIEAGGEALDSWATSTLSLVEQMGLPTVQIPKTTAFSLVCRGSTLSSRHAQARLDDAERLLAVPSVLHDMDPHKPWEHERAAQYDTLPLSDFIDEQPASDEVKELAHAMCQVYNGQPTRKQSTLAYAAQTLSEETESRGNQAFRLAQGNASLPRALAQSLGNSVHYNQAVTGIAYRDGPSHASISFAHGPKVRADYVVLTVLPTAWPSIEFDPPLLPEGRPQIGYSMKVLSKEPPAGIPNVPGRTLYYGGKQDHELYKLWSVGEPAYGWVKFMSGYPAESPAGDSTQIFNWPQTEGFRGAYACPGLGEHTTLGPKLRQAFGGKLLLSGDWCNAEHPGYMEGSVRRGIETANTLLRLAAQDDRRSGGF